MAADYQDFIGDKSKSLGKALLARAMHYRDFEITLSWERAKYFTLLLSAIFIAYYSVSGSWLKILLLGLGTIISFIWYLVNRGSKMTYENWEHHIDFIESAYCLGTISRTHIYKGKNCSNLLGAYPISSSKANNLVSLIITFAFGGALLYEMGLLKIFYFFCPMCLLCMPMIILFIVAYIMCLIPHWIQSSNYNNTNSQNLFAYDRINGKEDVLKHK